MKSYMALTVSCLLIVATYICLIYISLDELDMIALKHGLFHIKQFSDGASIISNVPKVLPMFLIPFKDQDYFSLITNGSLYTAYMFKYYSSVADKFNNKVYWYEIFKTHGINTPQIHLIKQRYVTKINDLEMTKYYIHKPIVGMLSYNVFKFLGRDIDEIISKHDDFIVQDFISDCSMKNNRSRKFRYVTLYNGDEFQCTEVISNTDTDVATLETTFINGYFRHCKDGNLTINEKKALATIKTQLSVLHKSLYHFIFSIGWDIIFSCTNPGEIVAYCCEGNIANSNWGYPYLYDILKIRDYKDTCLSFIRNNGLT